MGNNTVTIRMNRIPAVKRKLLSIANNKMEAGYFADGAGGRIHEGKKSSVATIAGWHELGTENMPARPFMTNGVELFKKDQRSIARIVRIAIQGDLSGYQLAQRMGKILRLKIRRSIRDGNFAALSIYTIYNKGSDTPLRDTDLMYNSLENRVK